MNSVFELGVLFATQEDWNRQDKQDAFLEHLLNHLLIIQEYQHSRVFWSDGLETLLWAEPQQHPWFGSDLRNPIILTIFQYFSSNVESLGDLEVENADSPQAHFQALLDFLLDAKESFFFCTSESNAEDTIAFSRSDEEEPYHPTIIRKPLEWFHQLNAVDYYPSSLELFETELLKGLKVVKYQKYLDLIHSKEDALREDLLDLERNLFVYGYAFERGFIKKLLGVTLTRHKEAILEKMTDKLMLLPTDAGFNALGDEKLKGQDLYRFRITPRPTSTRMHYALDQNTIVFTAYYGEGEHDDGL